MFSPLEICGRETGLFLFLHHTFPFRNDPSVSRRTPLNFSPSERFRTFGPAAKFPMVLAPTWHFVIFIVFFTHHRIKFADRIDNGNAKVKPTLMPFQSCKNPKLRRNSLVNELRRETLNTIRSGEQKTRAMFKDSFRRGNRDAGFIPSNTNPERR